MKIILASKSPRRQELIKGLELDYSIVTYEVDESFDASLTPDEIASSLAIKKSEHYPGKLSKDELLLTADTIVWINHSVLNKPSNKAEALEMLQQICGETHSVYTGVCLRTKNKTISFSEKSEVSCKQLNLKEMEHYIDNYKPYDKAGSYGIQDWFGYTAVERINGCFYNVMGLPVSKIYEVLKKEFGLTLLMLFMSFVGFSQTRTVIEGKLPAKKGQAMLQFFANPFDNEPTNRNFEIGEDGNFKEVMNMSEGQMIAFVDAKDFMRFYIKPGDSLNLSVDPKDAQKLVISGKGNKDAIFGYKQFLHFKSTTESVEFQKIIGIKMNMLSPQAFKFWADSIVKEKQSFLQANGQSLSSEAKLQIGAENFYEFENLKLTYPQYYENRRKSNSTLPALDASYFDFLKNVDLNQSKIMHSPQYRTFQKLNLIKAINDNGQKLTIVEIWKYCETFFKGEVLKIFRLHIWADIVYNSTTEDAGSLYKLAQTECQNLPGYTTVEAAYLDKLPFTVGSKAYPFKMKDAQGNLVSLEDFKGKVVYLDFWASWCRPCLGEIPAGEELKKYFAGKDVVFINISIDEGEQNWIAAKNRYSISGIHLLSNNGNSPEVQKKYKVTSIPSYFLIGKDGNFISAPAPRPSAPNIYNMIEEALKK